jgi:hypothetical protein
MNPIIFFSNKDNKDITFRIFCLLDLEQHKTLTLLNSEINDIITNIMYQLFADFYSSINEHEIIETQLKKFRWIIKWLYMKNKITLKSITKKYLKYDSALFKPINRTKKQFNKYLSVDFYYYCDIILPLVFNTNNNELIILDRPRDSTFKPKPTHLTGKDTHIEIILEKINNSIFIRNDELCEKINSYFLYNRHKHILLWATQCGYLDVVQYYILKTQIKIDKYYFGSVALEYASKMGYLEIVRYLISVGVSPEANNNEAIKCACDGGHLEIVKCLVLCNVNFGCGDCYPLRMAHKNNHVEVVKYLKSLGEQYIDEALISASQKYDLDTIKHLISLSENPKITDAFCTAYFRRYSDIAEYLETQICDVSPLSHSLLSSEDINSSIICASKYKDLDTLKFFMTAYANYINREEIIKEILRYALKKNHTKIIEYLISIIFLPLVSYTYERVYEKNITSCTNVNIINVYGGLDNYYVSFITPCRGPEVEFIKEHCIYFSNEKITVMYPCASHTYKLKNYIPLVENDSFVPLVDIRSFKW